MKRLLYLSAFAASLTGCAKPDGRSFEELRLAAIIKCRELFEQKFPEVPLLPFAVPEVGVPSSGTISLAFQEGGYFGASAGMIKEGTYEAHCGGKWGDSRITHVSWGDVAFEPWFFEDWSY